MPGTGSRAGTDRSHAATRLKGDIGRVEIVIMGTSTHRHAGRTPSVPAGDAGLVGPPEAAGELALLDRVLAQRAVRSVYQPLVELDTGATVAFEALARGPQGSALERPDLLFAAARRARRVTDLDIACRAAAVTGAQAAGLVPPYRLFVNAEPEALDGWRPGPSTDSGQLPLTVIVELTERALAARPAQLLQSVTRIRSYGWGVALDDVGADPSSLALLPMLRPDVIKLDLRLVQQRATQEIASIMNAVHAEAERSGTLVLAEGLETEQHVQTARAFGATIGQGWFFGRPGPLPSPLPAFRGQPVQIVPHPTGGRQAAADRGQQAAGGAGPARRRVRSAARRLPARRLLHPRHPPPLRRPGPAYLLRRRPRRADAPRAAARRPGRRARRR